MAEHAVKGGKEAQINQSAVNLIGKISDWIIAAQGLNLPKKVLGFGFNDSVVGAAGIVASLVALNNVWSK